MSGQKDAVTVRRLPDGEPEPARIESEGRRRIRVVLLRESRSEYPAGTLVEVQAPEAVYLGAVVSRQDSSLAVAVEHTINRAALAEIENVWHKP
jgi:hypothetical protein